MLRPLPVLTCSCSAHPSSCHAWPFQPWHSMPHTHAAWLSWCSPPLIPEPCARIADWMLVDLACHAQSIVPVPLYDTLGPEAVEYIVKHAELSGIACSAKVFPTLALCLPQCPSVKLVVRPN